MLELIHTADGSTTILNTELNATYHSKFGAIQESTHIFINNGLKFITKKNINVLEIGFGTGLNAMLTLQEAIKGNLSINYSAIEKYPLEKEVFEKLNYFELIDVTKEQLDSVLNCEWEKENKINSHFSITKFKSDANEFSYTQKADVIYYDAFGPGAAPEMWQSPIFEKLYSILNTGGCIITFCAQGELKRILKRCGFTVESLQGPPGKREITRAIKN